MFVPWIIWYKEAIWQFQFVWATNPVNWLNNSWQTINFNTLSGGIWWIQNGDLVMVLVWSNRNGWNPWITSSNGYAEAMKVYSGINGYYLCLAFYWRIWNGNSTVINSQYSNTKTSAFWFAFRPPWSPYCEYGSPNIVTNSSTPTPPGISFATPWLMVCVGWTQGNWTVTWTGYDHFYTVGYWDNTSPTIWIGFKNVPVWTQTPATFTWPNTPMTNPSAIAQTFSYR